MSRSNPPSVLSTLTAYDSSTDEEAAEENESGAEPKVNNKDESMSKGQVTVILPLASTSGNNTLAKGKNLVTSLAHDYDEEENFDYRPPPEEEEDDDNPENKSLSQEQDTSEKKTNGEDLFSKNNGNQNHGKTERESTSGKDISSENDKTAKDAQGSFEEGEPMPKKSRQEKYPWLFAETEGKCSPKIQKHFEKLFAAKQSGIDINDKIQRIKDFRNPSIYEKLIDVCGIDEYGTNFQDQHEWDPSSYYDELDKVQRIEMERRIKEKERKAKELKEAVKVELVSGMVKKPDAANAAKPKPSSKVPVVATATSVPNKQPSAYIRAFGNLTFKN